MASVLKRSWKTETGETKVGWRVSFVDSNGKRTRRQFASKREADAFRIEIEGQLKSGSFRADAAKVTLKETANQFLVHCEARMERGERMTRHNYKTYEGHVRNYICPDPKRHAPGKRPPRLRPFQDGMGSQRLEQITACAVGDFRDGLRRAGVSVPTTRKILGTLKLVLGYAISRDLISVNAAKDIKVIGRRDEGSKKIVPPSKEAMKRLMKVADEDFRVKLIVAGATGMRAGEFHALRWHHVDFEKGEVEIETRVDAYGKANVRTHL